MTLYLAQNGEKSGPFTLDQVQELIRTGNARDTDLAWYEGQTTWVPLHDVPGFIAPRPPRPIGVWIISLLFFACTPFSVLGLVVLGLMQAGTIPHQQTAVLQQFGPLEYCVSLVNTVLVLTWAVLFFMLKRASIYFFIASLGLGILMMLYNLILHGTIVSSTALPAMAMMVAVVTIIITWVLNLALLYYNWHLIRKGVLR